MSAAKNPPSATKHHCSNPIHRHAGSRAGTHGGVHAGCKPPTPHVPSPNSRPHRHRLKRLNNRTMPSPLIEIPPDDIFKNDRLGLEPAIQGRTHALLSRSPQAVAIDGRWGTGKSTFLALWSAYLQSIDVKVVQFNAWKSFRDDPFDALTREILRQVNVPGIKQNEPHKRLVSFLNR